MACLCFQQPSVATGYGLDSQCLFPVADRDYSLSHIVRTFSTAHSPSYPEGIGIPLPGVKFLGREADQPLPSIPDVKNVVAIFPLPIRLHSVVLN
jgi:hypothetical protein